jgi:hypothetical protein
MGVRVPPPAPADRFYGLLAPVRHAGGMYTIEPDHENCLLHLRLQGFWTAEIARSFAIAQQEAAGALACPPGAHLSLADLTEFKIQSQETVAICAKLIASAGNRSRRLAIVAGTGLARIQIKRVLLRDEMQVFDDVSSARRWLLDARWSASAKVA